MIGGMIGNKAVATRAVFKEQPYILEKERILTGAQPLKAFFEHFGAYNINSSNRTDQPQAPKPTILSIIDGDKCQDKYVEWRPENGITKVG